MCSAYFQRLMKNSTKIGSEEHPFSVSVSQLHCFMSWLFNRVWYWGPQQVQEVTAFTLQTLLSPPKTIYKKLQHYFWIASTAAQISIDFFCFQFRFLICAPNSHDVPPPIPIYKKQQHFFRSTDTAAQSSSYMMFSLCFTSAASYRKCQCNRIY